MIIVTNPGSNLPEGLVERYDIQVTPQQIVVDGVSHDTRFGIELALIDGWVRTAREHPHVVGTTAAEFVSTFRAALRHDREVLAIMTSRKIIGSYDAAQVAARTLLRLPGEEGAKITVFDTGVTDVGAGLSCILAGEARAAGMPLEDVVQLLEACRREIQVGFVVETLEYLVKGGRATALRAFFANLFGLRPLIAFSSGELKMMSKVSARADAGIAIAQWIAGSLGQGRRVAAAVFHGDAPHKAQRAAEELRRRLDVACLWLRPLSPSIYLHAGPGAVGVAAVPLDQLPWWPAHLRL
ncbi:DegV family protein [Chondromyces crocatus]|uniref:DegV family protein n=1 Tax=Chondromyces crocatus TaxID=52 RepID=A0A0K1EFQ8_CHOCO|nr:DegV family protein [Chondromyces crocatus]AKT39674.1 uncharacterized protein CMC5_038230 [Chondromyces crocatus]